MPSSAGVVQATGGTRRSSTTRISRAVYVAGRLPLIGRLLRRISGSYREGSIVRIRRGVMRGMKWKRHHRYVNGYWLGIAEPDVEDLMLTYVKEGDTFYDLGASAGYFSLMGARIVGNGGKVVSIDPMPENCSSVREQLEVNGLSEIVSIRQEAVAGQAGSVTFSFNEEGDSSARIGTTTQRHPQSRKVTCTTLDRILEEEGAPDVIKMDIEGGEVNALKGATTLLREHRPVIILEVHGHEATRGVRELIGDAYDWKEVSRADQENGSPRHVLLLPRGQVA